MFVPSTATHTSMSTAHLYADYRQSVFFFMKKRGLSESDAEDATQEVFIVVHSYGGYQAGPAAPWTWLYSIAVFVLCNMRRYLYRRKVKHSELDVDLQLTDSVSPHDFVSSTQGIYCIHGSVAAMSPPLKSVLLAYLEHGPSCQDVAVAMSIPVGTVYSRLHHARESLILTCDL